MVVLSRLLISFRFGLVDFIQWTSEWMNRSTAVAEGILFLLLLLPFHIYRCPISSNNIGLFGNFHLRRHVYVCVCTHPYGFFHWAHLLAQVLRTLFFLPFLFVHIHVHMNACNSYQFLLSEVLNFHHYYVKISVDQIWHVISVDDNSSNMKAEKSGNFFWHNVSISGSA